MCGRVKPELAAYDDESTSAKIQEGDGGAAGVCVRGSGQGRGLGRRMLGIEEPS